MATIAQKIKTKIESNDLKKYSIYANAYLIERQGNEIALPLYQCTGTLDFRKVDELGKVIYQRMLYADGSRLVEEYQPDTKTYKLIAIEPHKPWYLR